MEPAPEQVTQILDAVGAGDAQAAEKLQPLVYSPNVPQAERTHQNEVG